MKNDVFFGRDKDNRNYILVSYGNYRNHGRNGYETMLRWFKNNGYLLDATPIEEGLLADSDGNLYKWTESDDSRLITQGSAKLYAITNLDEMLAFQRAHIDFRNEFDEWKKRSRIMNDIKKTSK